MKALSIIFLCSMLINASLFSQADRENKTGDFPHLQMLTEELDLTDDQVKQLESLFLEKREAAKALREESKEFQRLKRAERKEMKLASKEEMKEILTEEQFAKLETLHKEKRKARKEKGKKMKSEMRAFHKKEMHPDLKKWRAEFDEQIAAEDKLLIEELRQSKHEIRAKIKELKDSARNDDNLDRQEMKERIKALKDEFQPRKEDLKYLVEKYKEPVKELFDEHKEEMQSWKKEMREIREKNRNEMKEGKARKGKSPKKRDRKRFKKKFGPAMFLLLDPEATDDFGEAPSEIKKSMNLKAFPNPSHSQSMVEFDIEQDGHYRLDLIDPSGTLVETFINKNLEAGKQQLEIDLTNFKGNTYHLRLSGPVGTETKTLFLQRN